MGLAIFEKYSATSSSKKSKIPTLEINKSANTIFHILLDLLKKEEFENIESNQEYLDIYAEKFGYELSIQIYVNGLKTNVDLSVYGENKRGKTRKFLITYYQIIKNALN